MLTQQQQDALLDAIELVLQTFQRLIEPLVSTLGLDFVYAIVIDERYYYLLHRDIEFLRKFARTISHGVIFCGRNITGHYDHGYNFTLWSDHPKNENEQIFWDHGHRRGGLTISKKHSNCIELYGFIPRSDEWTQEDFICEKELLLKWVHYFDCHKALVCSIPREFVAGKGNLFELKNGFNPEIPPRECKWTGASEFLKCTSASGLYIPKNGGVIAITPRECEVYCAWLKTYNVKKAAELLGISESTVLTRINSVHLKLDCNSRFIIAELFRGYHLLD